MASNDISQDVIRQFCPEFRFHPQEKAWPCSIEYLLQGATLLDNDDASFAIENPSPEDLYTYHQSHYRVRINSTQFSGGNQRCLYYSVKPASDDFIDLTYVLLYAMQYGQVIHVDTSLGLAKSRGLFGGITSIVKKIGEKTVDSVSDARKVVLDTGKDVADDIGHAVTHPVDTAKSAFQSVGEMTEEILGKINPCDFYAITSNWGEHQGDIERVTVRIRPDGAGQYTLVNITYEAHGTPSTFTPGEVELVADTHPVAYIGLNQHPHHNRKGETGESRLLVPGQDFKICQILDVISDEGIHWQAWTGDEAQMKEIGLRNGEPINEQRWAKFSGRLGLFSKASLNSAVYLHGGNPHENGGNLNSTDWTTLKVIGGYIVNDVETAIVGVVGKDGLIPNEDGPGGINNQGSRPWAFLD